MNWDDNVGVYFLVLHLITSGQVIPDFLLDGGHKRRVILCNFEVALKLCHYRENLAAGGLFVI